MRLLLLSTCCVLIMENSEASASASQADDFLAGGPGHWCHQCRATIVVQAAGDEGLICPDCGGGFIEAMDTANTLAFVRRAVRRQRRRQPWPSHSLRSLERPVDDPATEEELEDASPQQVLRFLRFLSRTFRNSPPLSSRSSEAFVSDITHESYASDGHNSGHDQNGIERSDSSLESMSRVVVSLSQTRNDTVNVQVLGQEEDRSANVAATENIENSVVVHGDVDEEDVEGEGDEEIDSEVESQMLELSDWESFEQEDEDEWEEVAFNDPNLVVRFLEAVNNGIDGDGEPTGNNWENGSEAHATQGEVAEGNSESENNQRQTRYGLSRSLRRRLQAIRRTFLEDNNTEVQLEGPNFDPYIGNPGDYVDAHGFEELLQQLIETDNTCRGAPPAAKAAIEGLCSVKIKEENLENGSAVCAICKDVVALNEPAKQLPCLHLYHSACIVAWLNARNSCPLCRYELPTDDPDYEERRKGQSETHLVGDTGNASSNATRSESSGGEVTVAEDNTGDEATQVDLAELPEDKEKGGELSQQLGQGNDDDGKGTVSKSSLGQMLTGPLFSLAGFVLLSCLGNLFVSGNFQLQTRIPLACNGKTLRNVQNDKPWWMRVFG